MEQPIKLVFVTLLIFSFQFGFGQCTKTKLMKDFYKRSENYKAVSFKVKKMMVTINSFDLQSKRDTSYTYENYWCIREKNKVNYLKENSIKGYTLSYNDTLVITFTDKYAIKNDLDFAKQSEFENALYFLGKQSDTFYCNNSDSVINLNSYSFNMFSNFESEVGPGSVQLEFTFDNKGTLIRKESFYNMEFAIPKIYTKIEFSECKYYSTPPAELITKLKLKHKQAIQLLKKPKKVFSDSTTYIVVKSSFKKYAFKQIISPVLNYNIDSVIKSNKITLVYFWFQGCMPCAKLKPELNLIYETFKPLGLQIIGLNDVDNQAIIDSTKTQYKNFLDKNRNVLLFKEGYPQIIVLNSNGEMIGRLFGYSKTGIIELKKHLSELLN